MSGVDQLKLMNVVYPMMTHLIIVNKIVMEIGVVLQLKMNVVFVMALVHPLNVLICLLYVMQLIVQLRLQL